jgi:hypothetical protein
MDRQKPIDEGVVRSPTPREKVVEWQRKYLQIRPEEFSNTAAFKRIAEEDQTTDRHWDPRTVGNHLKRQLPLGPANTLNSLADFVSFMEARLPLQRLVADCEEKAPIAEVGKQLSNMVQKIISENPRPDQGLRAFANLLAGGFPLDDRNL